MGLEKCRTCGVDRSIDQVGFAMRLPSTDRAREEAQGARLHVREAQPTNVDADRARRIHWQKCYGDLWKLKLAFDEKHNG